MSTLDIFILFRKIKTLKNPLLDFIKSHTQLSENSIVKTIKLLDEGATIPFRHNQDPVIDLNTGEGENMGTEYDDFSIKANTTNKNLDSEILKNREVLISVMNNNGFSVYPYEWWHFDFKEWVKFELLDLSFEQLEKTK